MQAAAVPTPKLPADAKPVRALLLAARAERDAAAAEGDAVMAERDALATQNDRLHHLGIM